MQIIGVNTYLINSVVKPVGDAPVMQFIYVNSAHGQSPIRIPINATLKKK